jgi:hypothetical protein
MSNNPQANQSVFSKVYKLAEDILGRKCYDEILKLLDDHKIEGIVGTEKALDEMRQLLLHHEELKARLYNILLTRRVEIETKARQFSERNVPYNKEWSLV